MKQRLIGSLVVGLCIALCSCRSKPTDRTSDTEGRHARDRVRTQLNSLMILSKYYVMNCGKPLVSCSADSGDPYLRHTHQCWEEFDVWIPCLTGSTEEIVVRDPFSKDSSCYRYVLVHGAELSLGSAAVSSCGPNGIHDVQVSDIRNLPESDLKKAIAATDDIVIFWKEASDPHNASFQELAKSASCDQGE